MTTVLVTATADGRCRHECEDVDVIAGTAYPGRPSRSRGYDDRPAA